MSRIKFLITLGSAIRNGAVKTIKQAVAFAEQQFGKIDKSFVDDIVNVFKKEGKIKKKGDVVPIKKQEGIVRRPEEFATRKEYERYLDETLGPSDDVFGSPMKDDLLKEWDKVNAKNVTPNEGIMATDEAAEVVKKRTDDIAKGDPTGETSDLMKDLEDKMTGIKKAADELKKSTTKPEGIMEQIVKGQRVMSENYKTGNIRTAVREFMRSEQKAGRLKLNETDSFRIREYSPMTEDDPIDVFRRHYGEDALDAVDEIGDVFQRGESFSHYEQLLRENVDPKILTVKKIGAGEYDASVVAGEKLRKAQEQEAKNLKILEDFKPDREPNAYGGIAGNLRLNRTGFGIGSAPKGFKLAKRIRESKEYKKFIENLFLKASTLIRRGEGLFKDLTQSQKIKQHDNLTQEAVKYQKTGELPESVHQYFGMNPEHVYADKLLKKQLKMSPEEELRREFPGITDDLVNKVLTDKNKQRIAEVKATMKEALKMQEKGMGTEEIINIFKKTPRTKNAHGGLIDILKL